MFVLVERSDALSIPANMLQHDYVDVLNNILSNKYAGKVLLGEGLCIGIYDIVEMGDAYVFPGKGEPTVKVNFRIVVFRPFVGEVIVGTISQVKEEGIVVSLGFSEDVFVPASFLPEPSEFSCDDPQEHDHPRAGWFWVYENEDEEGNKEEMRFWADVNDKVRLRVHSVHFQEDKESIKSSVSSAIKLMGSCGSAERAMHVVGKLNEVGLGPTHWWDGANP
eukprot:TRINITY_DN25340_c0_g1_i2.p1 TRINITY_DN25340_c0_g1~~TRINITY_DN25340_c0_g1_i2.p1  ORF type:complete len:221 (-),score=48.01 TRINITY_DN25340_c0_g1_i2:202-864(-)